MITNRKTVHVNKSPQNKYKSEDVVNKKQMVSHFPISLLFAVFVLVRMLSATFSIITDCDEVYNYWEPLHYLLHGSGMQTWEYSPAYALRSYAYLFQYLIPAKVFVLVTHDKITQFFMLRSFLALICSICEVIFYRALCKQFGLNTAKIAAIFLLVSSGMFISATAFLPSTYSMYLTMTAFSAWFLNRYEIAIVSVAASSIIGWPFAAVIGLTIAYDIAIRKKMLLYFVKWALISLAILLVPLVIIDSYYYGHFVLPPLNIVLYNVFSSHGPDLYGVSPFSYYIINGFLNFNVGFLLSLVSLPLWIIVCKFLHIPENNRIPVSMTLLPLYIWLIIFFTRPHKEERFLYPVYPLIVMAASIALDSIQKLYAWMVPKNSSHYTLHTGWISTLTILVFSILSVSRSVALYKGYKAPMDVFTQFYRITHHQQPIDICMGKDWYRYPSSFFLPNNRVRLRFIRSEFRGQLPSTFSSHRYATRITPQHMNDLNKEESSRYVNASQCEYLVDLGQSDISSQQPDFSNSKDWKVLYTQQLLDPSKSHRIFRAFYLPWIYDTYTTFKPLNLLQNRRKKLQKSPS